MDKIILNYLQEERKELETLQERLKKRINNEGQEILVILEKQPGNIQYYKEYNKNGKRTREYIRNDNKDLVNELAQKSYNRRMYRLVAKKVEIINQFLKQYPICSLESIYDNMSENRKALIKPIILSEQQYIERWYENNKGQMNQYPISNGFVTNRNEVVRSKSEKIIADMFDKYDIPYVYEPMLTLKRGKVVFPDFKVLNKRNHEEYYYEHLGMMDKPEYASENIAKMHEYEENGYYSGNNMIYSFETTGSALNVSGIKHMIEFYLV